MSEEKQEEIVFSESQSWKHIEKAFCVEAYHWKGETREFRDGGNRWNVYLYVYPKSKFFQDIDKDASMYQDAILPIPLHGGCTHFSQHCNTKGDVLSFRIGCDYAHLHDDHYSQMDYPDSILADAKELVEWARIHC